VVLDGVVPQSSRSASTSRARRSALERISRGARPTTVIRAANLPEEFHELPVRLDKESVKTASPYATDAEAEQRATRPQIRRVAAADPVRLLSYSSATIALLPAMLHEAHEANYAPLANQISTTLRRLPESLSSLMSNPLMHGRRAVRDSRPRDGLDNVSRHDDRGFAR
jgi:hypothetical protein